MALFVNEGLESAQTIEHRGALDHAPALRGYSLIRPRLGGLWDFGKLRHSAHRRQPRVVDYLLCPPRESVVPPPFFVQFAQCFR